MIHRRGPTFHGTKNVDSAPELVLGGPGLLWSRHLVRGYKVNCYTYHMRLAVIIPARRAVSHIYAKENPYQKPQYALHTETRLTGSPDHQEEFQHDFT